MQPSLSQSRSSDEIAVVEQARAPEKTNGRRGKPQPKDDLSLSSNSMPPRPLDYVNRHGVSGY